MLSAVASSVVVLALVVDDTRAARSGGLGMIERGTYDPTTKTLDHVRGCHLLTLAGVFDSMVGNPRQDCDCGAYEDYLHSAKAYSSVQREGE